MVTQHRDTEAGLQHPAGGNHLQKHMVMRAWFDPAHHGMVMTGILPWRNSHRSCELLWCGRARFDTSV